MLEKSISQAQGAEGRLHLNFQAHPYSIWGGFFESLKHAKISYTFIEILKSI